jgi:hypothetical protein
VLDALRQHIQFQQLLKDHDRRDSAT